MRHEQPFRRYERTGIKRVLPILALLFGLALLVGGVLLLVLAGVFSPLWIGYPTGGICILFAILLLRTLNKTTSTSPHNPSSGEQLPSSLASLAQGDEVSNTDDTHLPNQKQTSGADLEREARSKKAGEVHAGAFKIYVVHTGFLMFSEETGPWMPDEQGWWRQNLLQLELSEILVEDQDIEIYEWGEHKLILGEQATRRLQERPSYWCNTAYWPTSFVVTLRERRLYGGFILPLNPSRPPQCPVLYVGSQANRLVLYTFPPNFVPRLSGQKAYMEGVNMEAMRSHFRSLGKLKVEPGRS